MFIYPFIDYKIGYYLIFLIQKENNFFNNLKISLIITYMLKTNN